jgi:hypothetical protein
MKRKIQLNCAVILITATRLVPDLCVRIQSPGNLSGKLGILEANTEFRNVLLGFEMFP